MGAIIQLSKELANQIAAGEVVERPLSVVKELVENSIDAGATHITIDITDGGKSNITVTDNGAGIASDELSLALEKYSTSKIKSIEDLYHVMTFGFRGEALASIASVSQFEIISKPANQSNAYSVSLKDGHMCGPTPCAGENGTKIIVENLFYNTPARLNYLKTDKTEQQHVVDCVQKMALSYPNIGFTLNAGGKNIFQYKSDETLDQRIYHVYGNDFYEHLLPLDIEHTGISLSGYISDPKVSFPNKNRQCLFVNHRIVSCPLLYKAILNAYNRFIPHGNFCGYVINVQIDPSQIDVNVHPRKQEVRFAGEQELFRTMYHSVNTLLENVSLENINTQTQDTVSHGFENKVSETPKQYYTGSGAKFKAYSPYTDRTTNLAQASIDFSKAVLSSGHHSDTPEEKNTDLHMTPLGKIIGQVHNSYIVVETDAGIQILDQHALAERIIYEKLISSEYRAKTQGLLLGVTCQLQPKEMGVLEQYSEIFENMGFDFEMLSHGMVQISGIPDFVQKEDIENVFLGIISDVGEQGINRSTTLEEIRNKIFASTACRSAIKFGHKLSLFEMNALLHDAVVDYSSTCPHGRPVVYEIELEELQNKYER
ncbi:DNA mismatch repair endonuclease MutL [Candidatus Gracilibacteria bacterium]|nr:DNA mismatch repair endonuclease MutL [Candidatus Gracilibacteria bacterium]